MKMILIHFIKSEEQSFKSIYNTFPKESFLQTKGPPPSPPLPPSQIPNMVTTNLPPFLYQSPKSIRHGQEKCRVPLETWNALTEPILPATGSAKQKARYTSRNTHIGTPDFQNSFRKKDLGTLGSWTVSSHLSVPCLEQQRQWRDTNSSGQQCFACLLSRFSPAAVQIVFFPWKPCSGTRSKAQSRSIIAVGCVLPGGGKIVHEMHLTRS